MARTNTGPLVQRYSGNKRIALLLEKGNAHHAISQLLHKHYHHLKSATDGSKTNYHGEKRLIAGKSIQKTGFHLGDLSVTEISEVLHTLDPGISVISLIICSSHFSRSHTICWVLLTNKPTS